MTEANLNLRQLYRLTELPGENSVKTAQGELDAAVRKAYGMTEKDDPLSFLLALNIKVAELEEKGRPVQGTSSRHPIWNQGQKCANLP